MRRFAFFILFFVVLATPFVLRWTMGISSGAARRSNLTLVVLTPHTESIKREFAEAFSRWHREKFGQDVDLDYRSLSANEIVRYLHTGRETVYARLGTYKVDLVWGGGDYLFDNDLKLGGFLEPVELNPSVLAAAFPQRELGGLPLYDRSIPPTWFGTALSSFGIVYNKDVLRQLSLPAPKTWADLIDPRYRNWLVLADPTRSGVAKAVFMVMVEHAMAQAAARGESENLGWAEGMGLIRQMSANARLFQDAGTTVAGWVSTGDVAAGTAIDFQARSQISEVGESRLGYIEPAGATAINPDPVAMVKGAPHRELATRFIGFLLSERGQRLWITRPGAPGGPRQTALRRLPIMRSVYDHPENFTDQVNPFDSAQGFNTSAARRRTMAVLDALIETSCMELLDELRQTRALILTCPDAKKLDAQLGIFPMEQTQAIALAERWKRLSILQRLEERRMLIERFRQEYAALRAKARESTHVR